MRYGSDSRQPLQVHAPVRALGSPQNTDLPTSKPVRGLAKFMNDVANWEERFYKAQDAFIKLKLHTKSIPAPEWSKDYRELAEMIHSLGREVFYVDFMSKECLDCKVPIHESPEGHRNEDGTFHICKQ